MKFVIKEKDKYFYVYRKYFWLFRILESTHATREKAEYYIKMRKSQLDGR